MTGQFIGTSHPGARITGHFMGIPVVVGGFNQRKDHHRCPFEQSSDLNRHSCKECKAQPRLAGTHKHTPSQTLPCRYPLIRLRKSRR